MLSLERSGQSEGLAFVSLSGLTLMLSADLGKAFRPIAGATELVFPVASVTSAYDRLNQRGCKFLNQPREVTPGSWAATFSDPDGHKLTVFWAALIWSSRFPGFEFKRCECYSAPQSATERLPSAAREQCPSVRFCVSSKPLFCPS